MITVPDFLLLDLRDAVVPLTFLKLSQVFREIETGKTMEILINDEETLRDIFKIFPPYSYLLISINDEETFCRIRLKKK